MNSSPIDTLYSTDGKRRIVIFRRESGTFGYREERYFQNDIANTEGWASLEGRSCYWDTLETAKREISENVTWLQKGDKAEPGGSANLASLGG